MAEIERSPDLPASFRARLAGLDIVTKRPHDNPHLGARRSHRKGASIEFADYRRYSPGDDYAQIDWNIYGRSDDLFIKIREAEELLAVHFLIDCSASMDRGHRNKLDYAINLVSALSYVALSSRDTVSIGCFSTRLNDEAGPFIGLRDAPRVVEFLGRIRSTGETSLVVPMREYAARRVPTGVVFLISDLLSTGGHQGLGILAQRGHETVVLHLLDKEDLSPDVGDDVELVDCETGDRVRLSGDESSAERYAANLHRWLEQTSGFCARVGVRYQAVETDWPVEEVVLNRLRMKGVLA